MTMKWLTIGIGVKRWLILATLGVLSIAVGIASAIVKFHVILPTINWVVIVVCISLGSTITIFSLLKLSRNLLAPYRRHQHGRVIDVVYAHSKRQKGLKVVAIGGGTGLPSVLRGLKAHTSNITAVVTVADDGGSSGRLRRDLGVLPPGDLRNNIAALADDESLMTQLFQYRFNRGDLSGHAFGNLFIAALAGISGGLEHALPEVERVLNIQGRVLPATLEDVNLVAKVQITDKTRSINIQGESKISELGGKIEQIALNPPDVSAFEESVLAILDADLVVIGPGSLYTSILPNLMVEGISEALKATRALKVYVCNVATQPGETDNYNVADHVLALERHIGRGVFQAVLANNAKPDHNKGQNTFYVDEVPEQHEILQRYQIIYTDLTDAEHPWRHDPQKLTNALIKLYSKDEVGESKIAEPILI
ncbi:MAG: uridine diphosphate-N-acetylglucosamine-binding protein YvcK [Chloroflexi bacterium]|nr:MAG: uridine diphosphate-N-acetylglucosamine-binding protein YvcK [Chloroflexota bacterium]